MPRPDTPIRLVVLLAIGLAAGRGDDGTMPADTTATFDGNGVSRTASGSSRDSGAMVVVRVARDGGPASRELPGDTISRMCVSERCSGGRSSAR